MRYLFWAAVVSLCCASSALAITRYVDASCATPVSPYTNWASAATTIQAAVNAAATGDEILVAPGTYLLSGNPVTIPPEKTLTLRSTQSRAAVIDAQKLSSGIWIRGTNSIVEGFTIRNGVTGSSGGGIYIMNPCTVRDCLVISNQAYRAGGIMIYATATVENCSIRNNLADASGGGVTFYADSPGVLRNCIISDNIVSNEGGGVYIDVGGSVSNCWISGNRALLSNGGGIYMSNMASTNSASVANCVLFNNQSGNYGGGIYSIGPAGTLSPVVNCTIVSNTAAADGGGVYAWTTRLLNNIIFYNSAPTNANLNWHESLLSCIVDHCCLSPNTGTSNFTNAPSFVNASAQDFHLATASPCIDAGTNNVYVPRIDCDGRPRPVVGTPGRMTADPDVGAYEYSFHFNDIRFISTNIVQLIWDVQDRGIYQLDAVTNSLVSPDWINNIACFTNGGLPAYQFNVHTQTVVIPPPIPANAMFRMKISHTVF